MIVVDRSRDPGKIPRVFARGTAPASPPMAGTRRWSTAIARRAALTCACRVNPRGLRWTTATCDVSGAPNRAVASYSARNAGELLGARPPSVADGLRPGRKMVAATAATTHASRTGYRRVMTTNANARQIALTGARPAPAVPLAWATGGSAMGSSMSQLRSSRRKATSCSRSRRAAAAGMATSAPTSPISVPPTSTATTETMPGTRTVLPITRGTSR
jgi:hypothetical protein